MSQRAFTDLIVIHCADTKPSMMHVNEDEIRQWHLARGWSDAGYNIVIPREPSDATTGFIEIARPLDDQGAHVAGQNHHALGICLVGGMSEDGGMENNFLPEQWDALAKALTFVLNVYPQCVIKGHRDLDNQKTCPNFDAQEWAVTMGFPV
jgi:N-acetylmuramoyl-L-alanine amidase